MLNGGSPGGGGGGGGGCGCLGTILALAAVIFVIGMISDGAVYAVHLAEHLAH
jgi:hypothetical protein